MSERGGGGLDARYEQVRRAALHARAEAFPLGFAVLTRRGVTGWRRALTDVTATPAMPGSPVPASASLPVAVTAELVDALAAVALAGIRPDRTYNSAGLASCVAVTLAAAVSVNTGIDSFPGE